MVESTAPKSAKKVVETEPVESVPETVVTDEIAVSPIISPDSMEQGPVTQYEIAVLFHPGLEIDLEKGSSKVEKAVQVAAGKITKTDNWGKRKLAYPIAKQEFAVYVFYTAEIPSKNVQQIERTLNITDEIIRFMITKPDLKAMAKAEALKAEKAKKAAERSENPPAGGSDSVDDNDAQARDSGEEE